MLMSDTDIGLSDLVMESMKLWTQKVLKTLEGAIPQGFSSDAYFLDVGADLKAKLEHDGAKITFIGKPDAVLFDEGKGVIHIWEYKLGQQGQIELQIAQLILYMALVEAAKGVECERGLLMVFRPEEKDLPEEATSRLGLIRAQSAFRSEGRGGVGRIHRQRSRDPLWND